MAGPMTDSRYTKAKPMTDSRYKKSGPMMNKRGLVLIHYSRYKNVALVSGHKVKKAGPVKRLQLHQACPSNKKTEPVSGFQVYKG
jgi:hypothetical protein